MKTSCTKTFTPGDVVMWDNRCVLHCADHRGVLGDRVMHREMVTDNSREQIGLRPG
jgi:taurine dioxygenase